MASSSITVNLKSLHPKTQTFLESKNQKLYINGQFVSPSSQEYLDASDPASGDFLTRVPMATIEDTDTAVASAKYAFEEGDWSQYTPRQREQVMHKLAGLIRDNIQSIAEIESLDSGKAITGCKAVDINGSANVWEYFAGWATKIEGATRDNSFPVDNLAYTTKEPVGVVGAIVPWNWPFAMATWKLAAPLAAGCTVVLKPAEITSLSMLFFAELCEEAGLPPGVINIVSGKGTVVGERLAVHPDVNKVSFTGSTAVGKRVGQLATEKLAHVTLELGSKSPMIAFADCDIDKLAASTLNSIFFNAGQVCSAGSRLYVDRKIYDDVLVALKRVAESITLGAPLNTDTVMGPIISQAQFDSIMTYISVGKDEGARVLCGGNSASEGELYIEPTIFVDCHNSMRIVQEEIFGPVLVVVPFDSDEEAVQLANDNEYGLAASIWTRDISRAMKTVPKIKAGSVWVNIHDPGDPSIPFGGVKASGIGKDLGPEQLAHYLETKSVWIAY